MCIKTYFVIIMTGSVVSGPKTSLATYCLLLPGKNLHLSALLAAKKFRGRGNKVAALEAFRDLEAAGLGKLIMQDSRRGTSAVSTTLIIHMCTCIHYNPITVNYHVSSLL